ncbi:MAG: motility protein A [Phycisphaerae bacterium]|nr:motility protein A [Phycisphaerae bacterium]
MVNDRTRRVDERIDGQDARRPVIASAAGFVVEGSVGLIDRATVFGLAATLFLLAVVIVAGAGWEAHAFWQTPLVALVLGGTLLTTVMAVPGARFRPLVRLIRNAFYVRTRPPAELVVLLVAMADIARRDGLLALERLAVGLNDDFLRRTMRMAIDGSEAATIEAVARAEMESVDLRHAAGAGMLESMGRTAPVFGMIGTLIGLVIMLGRMNDPGNIGPGMAVAMLTTLYGLVLAHVFCFPLARRLTHRSSEELLCRTITLKGVLAIHAGDNPRIVEQKLRAYLPPDALGEGSLADAASVREALRSRLVTRDRAHASEPAGVRGEAPGAGVRRPSDLEEAA